MPSVPQDHKRKKATAAPAEDRYAPTSWGTDGGGTEDLVVPSGQTCLVRRPGVQRLMEAGVLRDIDSLSSIVSEEHITRVKGKEKVDVESFSKDQDAVLNVLHVVDRVVCHCVVKPEVHMTPNDPTTRKDGVIYADMVDIEDKMFIFNFAVGGTRSVEQFRQESLDALGGVDAEQDTEEPTE